VSDDQTFEELLSPVLDPAFRLAMTMLDDRAAAEDAVQDAAIKAWRSFGKFRAGAEMRPWFLTIVANECRSARRSRWWHVWRSSEIAPPAVADELSTERIDLDAALARLASQHLLVLSLYYHLDLPIEEVARVLRCSEGAARQRIHRALGALRPGLVLEADA
jgi:RNA polymerase sigma-70 factor (ECF subfamily)